MIKVECGRDHSCGITYTGKMICWGYNYNGQIDVPRTTDFFDTPVDYTFEIKCRWSNNMIFKIFGFHHIKCVIL